MSIYKINEKSIAYNEKKENFYNKYAENALMLADSIDDDLLPDFIWHIQIQDFENDVYIFKFEIAAKHPELSDIFKIRAKYNNYWAYHSAMVTYVEYMNYIKNAVSDIERYGSLIGYAGIYIPPKPSMMGKKNKNIALTPRSRIYITEDEFDEYDFVAMTPDYDVSDLMLQNDDIEYTYDAEFNKKQAAIDRVRYAKKSNNKNVSLFEAIVHFINRDVGNPMISFEVKNEDSEFSVNILYTAFFGTEEEEVETNKSLAESIREIVDANTLNRYSNTKSTDNMSKLQLAEYLAESGFFVIGGLDDSNLNKKSRRAATSNLLLKYQSANGGPMLISEEEYEAMSKKDQKEYVKTMKMALRGERKKLSLKKKYNKNMEYDKYNFERFDSNKRSVILSEDMHRLQMRGNEINNSIYRDTEEDDMIRLNNTILSRYNSADSDDGVNEYFFEDD